VGSGAGSIVEEKKDGGAEDGANEEDPLVHKFSLPSPFKGLCESIKTNWDGWMQCATSADPTSAPLPAELPPHTVTAFQRLILIKALREDKLQASVAHFVAQKLGPKFAESPSSSMEEIYKDLDSKTPCIFVLSTGADPTGQLLRFARNKGFGDRLSIVSLGQGQGPFAKALMENGYKTGDWVVLQNCMLAKSWMPELDRLIFELQEKVKSPGGGGIHPDFRLYLTSFHTEYFPVAVLQNGVKMTNEPPKGFKSNILRSFGNLVKEEDFEGVETKSAEWKKLLCGLPQEMCLSIFGALTNS
jgi:dynein heavy chain